MENFSHPIARAAAVGEHFLKCHSLLKLLREVPAPNTPWPSFLGSDFVHIV